MKAIVSYMGTQYGGDISTTLENLKDFEPPPPEDLVDEYNYKDIYDEKAEKLIKSANGRSLTMKCRHMLRENKT